jgi:hypothetical protein
MNSLESLVNQGITNLQQGELETSLGCFIQALRQDSGSVYVSVNPFSVLDLKCQEIIIVISLSNLDPKCSSQSAVYIQEHLTA